MAKKKILVTGGAGYIGTHVVQSLLGRGLEVYVADPTYIPQDKNVHLVDVPIFSGDKNIFQLVGSPDILLHLAWQDGFKHNEDSHVENIPHHYRFIRDMVKGGLKHFVGMGSVHEIGYFEGAVNEETSPNPQSLYGIAKNALRQMTEQLIKDKEDMVYQWIRAYYIVGDDARSQSVFRKLLDAEERGDKLFPFTSGKNKHDFIDISTLGEQIASIVDQTDVVGIINSCSGVPVTLAEQVEKFITENNLRIRLDYGAFPDRPYDSSGIWGDNTKILQILSNSKN